MCSAATVRAAGSEKQPRTPATVFYLPAEGYSAKTLAHVSRTFNKALRRNERIRLRDSDKLLIAFSGEIPREAVQQAKESYAAGAELLSAGKARAAAGKLAAAVTELETVLPFIKKRRLAKAMLALGVAQAMAKHPRRARATFDELLTWRRRIAYDIKKYDGKYLPLFEAARRRVEKRKRGSIELITEPDGAQAYVDGRFVGVTPTVAFGLTVGGHYATFKRSGYIKGGRKVTVDPHRQRRYTVELKQSEKFLLVKETLSQARRQLGDDKLKAAANLRTLLAVHQVIFTTIENGGDGKMEINAYLYDLRTRLRLNKARTLASEDQLSSKLGELAQAIYAGVRYDGTIEAPPEPPPPPKVERTPFYATWWFWTAIAAGAAAVVIPVVVIPRGDSCPDGYRCALLQN